MVDILNLKLNKFQTPINEELKKSLHREIWNDLEEYISTVPYIKHLISDEEVRGYAKDRPKDEDGKIIVDLSKPHILEDMDFFRERAIFFEKNGKYTNIIPNSNPKSDYALFWKEELRRWKYGLVRESDGEWIPGELYFYWNYSPIWLVEKDSKQGKSSTRKSAGNRVRKFPKPWSGDYLFHHYIQQAKQNGQHGKLLKCRGIGFSFKTASWSPRNMYVYPGAGNPNFHLASEKGFLSGDKGIFGKVIECLDWIAETTPFSKLRLTDSKKSMEIQLGYLDEYGVRKGLLSSVYGISLKDNPEKARGIRGPLIHYEEDGLFPNLETAWGVNRKAVEDGDVAFGFMLAGGTGGTEGASFEGSEKLFYNPAAYNIYGIDNVFDKNVNGISKCGYFWGAYMNRNGCYETSNGESDVIKALIEILEDRFIVKYNSSDPKAITQKKAEECITPQEAVLRTTGTIFPVADLKDYLESIFPTKETFLAEHYVGDLIYGENGEVKWKPNPKLYPIRSYSKVPADKSGAVEIFEMPKRNGIGKIASSRYIIGCLPPGEKVLTDSGLKNIEEIGYEDKLINKEGDLVNIIECKKFTADEPLYEIKVGNTFRTTKFTGEHPLYVSDVNWKYHSKNIVKKLNVPYKYKTFNPSFKEVKDIKCGQWIKVPNIYKSKNNFDISTFWNETNIRIDKRIDNPLLKEDFWWFIGLWLGDGYCVGKNNITISLNLKEQDYIDKVIQIITKVFNRRVYIRERNGGIEVSFSNKQLNQFLNKHFGKYAKNKKLPEWSKRIENNFKLNLIGGYLASDGCIWKNTKYYSTEFVSINLELLESFQDILFSLGIISGLSKLRDAKEEIINSRIVKQQETYHLRLSNYDTIKLAKLLKDIDTIKINRIDKKYLENFNGKRYSVDCEFDENKDFIYFKIKDIIKSDYKGDVYNFECETNTFMCHHITTHNCDPIDADAGTSLFSALVMDTFTDRIVAEYTGRPRTAKQAYEITLKLALFYNAQINYENNLKGLFSYFDSKNKLYLLADTPQILRDMELIKGGNLYGNKSKGTNANARVNSWARLLQADWLLEKAQSNNDEDNRLNLHRLRSLAYIEELIYWNPDGNFDRVSAAGMLFILREDRLKRSQTAKDNQYENIKRLSDDPFFSKNYTNKFGNNLPEL